MQIAVLLLQIRGLINCLQSCFCCFFHAIKVLHYLKTAFKSHFYFVKISSIILFICK